MEALKRTEGVAARRRIDFDERVVAIEVETADGQPLRLYAIRDIHLDYWRSESPLHAHDAWTRDTGRRAVFLTRAEAERELWAIWDSRGIAPPRKRKRRVAGARRASAIESRRESRARLGKGAERSTIP